MLRLQVTNFQMILMGELVVTEIEKKGSRSQKKDGPEGVNIRSMKNIAYFLFALFSYHDSLFVAFSVLIYRCLCGLVRKKKNHRKRDKTFVMRKDKRKER